MKQQYPEYEVKQFNIIIDLYLGDGPLMSKRQWKTWSGRDQDLCWGAGMQKVILSHSLNIARAFKVLMWFFFLKFSNFMIDSH